MYILCASWLSTTAQNNYSPASLIDQNAINPSVAGAAPFWRVRMSSGWLFGGQKEQILTTDLPLYANKLGASLQVQRFQTLLLTNSSINLNGAYGLIQKTDKQLRFGLGTRITNVQLNTNRLTAQQVDDPLFPSANQNLWFIQFDAGVFYTNKRWNGSMSVKNYSKTIDRREIPRPSIHAILAYKINLSSSWRYTPSVYLKMLQKENQIAIFNKVSKNDFFIGVHALWPQGYYAVVGLPLQKGLSSTSPILLSYSFGQVMAMTNRPFLHEITLLFNLKLKNSEDNSIHNLPIQRSPVFF